MLIDLGLFRRAVENAGFTDGEYHHISGAYFEALPPRTGSGDPSPGMDIDLNKFQRLLTEKGFQEGRIRQAVNAFQRAKDATPEPSPGPSGARCCPPGDRCRCCYPPRGWKPPF